MSFDPSQTTQQISHSIGAILLLNSSCQALIEVTIAPSASPWYPVLEQELGQAENLVVNWRQSGYLYFQDQILGRIDACGKQFLAAQPSIDASFRQLQQQFDGALRDRVAAELDALAAPVQGMIDAIAAYTAKLAAFQQALSVPYANMNQSIAQIQAQEADIQAQISNINTQIAELRQQVQTDREAIAKAEAQRTTGIIETIFGVLLAPISGGASLILMGIGVGTIAEAQAKVSSLESTISQYQSTITGDQQQLSGDRQQIATLNGLTVSMSLALNDVTLITSALEALRTSWGVLLGEIGNAAGNVAQSKDAQQAIVAQVWFDAACKGWQAIDAYAEAMQGQVLPPPKMVSIG